MASYWKFANDLETRIYFLFVTALPMVLQTRLGSTSNYPQWSNISFYVVSVVAVWLTNRCFTPPNPVTPPSGIAGPRASDGNASGIEGDYNSFQSDSGRSGELIGLQQSSLQDRADSITPHENAPDDTRRGKTSKNGKSGSKSVQDGIGFVTKPLFLWTFKCAIYTLGIYHSLLALYRPALSTDLHSHQLFNTLCPHPENLNSAIFTFTVSSSITLSLIITSALLRLLAYHQLGQNFTFQLRKPSRLVKTGLYAWMQHPSYTFNIILVIANTFLYQRIDGGAACWVGGDESSNRWLKGVDVRSQWWNVLWVMAAMVGVQGTVVRITDEERILKGEFGKEWEEWHRRTKRLIPGVF